MAKKLHVAKLTGQVIQNKFNSPDTTVDAKTSNAGIICYFTGLLGGYPIKVEVDCVQSGDELSNDIYVVKLTTIEGSYILNKHKTQNYYHGMCKETKVQVSLKKIVGELRAWY